MEQPQIDGLIQLYETWIIERLRKLATAEAGEFFPKFQQAIRTMQRTTLGICQTPALLKVGIW